MKLIQDKNTNTSTDNNLLKDLIDGSEKAYFGIYKKYSGLLYAFIFKLTKSKELTEDVLQEVFIKVWSNRERLCVNTSFKSYLFAIAQNHVIDYFRKQMNHSEMTGYIDFLENETDTETSNAEFSLDFDLFCHQLELAKKTLTFQQKRIFTLCKEDGLTVSEIASLLHITEQSVRNQLSAALKILRKRLKRFLPLFICMFYNIS